MGVALGNYDSNCVGRMGYVVYVTGKAERGSYSLHRHFRWSHDRPMDIAIVSTQRPSLGDSCAYPHTLTPWIEARCRPMDLLLGEGRNTAAIHPTIAYSAMCSRAARSVLTQAALLTRQGLPRDTQWHLSG